RKRPDQPGKNLRALWRRLDRRPRISLIYKNETRASHGGAREAARPPAGDILRGSLLTRTIRYHVRSCAKCASGEGHRLSVLTVSYRGGRTRQFSLRSETVPVVRRCLANYQRLKEAIEAICELNHDLLRPDE